MRTRGTNFTCRRARKYKVRYAACKNSNQIIWKCYFRKGKIAKILLPSHVFSQGCKCVVFVPENMVAARREAIEREGAEIIVVQGNYDDAIAQVDR